MAFRLLPDDKDGKQATGGPGGDARGFLGEVKAASSLMALRDCTTSGPAQHLPLRAGEPRNPPLLMELLRERRQGPVPQASDPTSRRRCPESKLV